ncbi:MAG: HEAT repeat domain-containing protein [Methanomicrobiaceae archaeon]|nr:HEAT repeat domain-containing protein [Methanomicrobiaceae archaeon]
MMETYFCPNCGHRSLEVQEICPACGYTFADHTALSYDERLIMALRHPIRETRMIATEILGKRQYAPAVAAFADLLATETDYYTVREVVRALRRIDTPESIALERGLYGHPSPLVRALLEEPCTR